MKPTSFHSQKILHLYEPKSQNYFEIRKDELTSQHGFQKKSDVSFIHFNKKLGIKQSQFSPHKKFENMSLNLGEKKISWNLNWNSQTQTEISLIPSFLKNYKIFSFDSLLSRYPLPVSGTIQIQEEIYTLDQTSNYVRETVGQRFPKKSLTIFCNHFLNEKGEPAEIQFLCTAYQEKRFKVLDLPLIRSLYLNYKNQEIRLDQLKHSFCSQSKIKDFESIEFYFEHKDYNFRGSAQVEKKNLIGVSHEDSDGSILHDYLSPKCSIELQIYKKNRLEAAFYSKGFSYWCWSSTLKNPYVSLLY